jgi:hypothetical protein
MLSLKQALHDQFFDNLGLQINKGVVEVLDFYDNEQKSLKISGNVAEIGVAEGSFFIPLALCCESDELAIALDVFDESELNWNPTGGRSSIETIRKVAELARVSPIVRIIKADSLHVEASRIISTGADRKVRLFSIDGAHSTSHTVNDLTVAGEAICPGGIVILDDVQNWGWPGVIDGFARYSLLQPYPRLLPFFLFGNKMLLTTACHHRQMLEAAVRYTEGALGRIAEHTYRISRFFGSDVVGF